MAYGDFKSLPRRTAFDKVLPDKGFNFAKNPKFDGYQKGVAFLIKVLLVAVLKVKLSQNSNWQKNYTSQLLES